MKKFLTSVIIFFAGALAALILTHGSLQAQDATGNREVIEKLNEVARSQQDIISALNSVKEDIKLIKIRVTQSQ